MRVDFYYKFILINKFIKHNLINYSCCYIKYIYLLVFSVSFLFIVNDFFFSFLYTIIIDLFSEMRA
jgi:hypothetical protein